MSKQNTFIVIEPCILLTLQLSVEIMQARKASPWNGEVKREPSEPTLD